MGPRSVGIVTVSMLLGLSGVAEAQTRDHLFCYKVRDPVALSGFAVVATRFGSGGCKLGKPRLYCEPATKTVLSSNHPVTPVAGRGLLDSRICYKLKCPADPAAFGGTTDQFGTHSVGPPKPKLLCVPAVYGPPMPPMDDVDDIKCYKGSDGGFNLSANVDAATLNLGTAAGCRARKTRYFCVAADTSDESVNVSPLLPIDGTGTDDDRVCYAVNCPRPYPGPQIVSDRFGSRTVTNVSPRILCGPANAPTTTTVVTTTTTTITFPPGSDPPVVCQRTIEAGAIQWALGKIDQIKTCGGGGSNQSLSACAGPTPFSLFQIQQQWQSDVAAVCGSVPGFLQILGYAPPTGEVPRPCGQTISDPATLVSALTCGMSAHLINAAQVLYADSTGPHPCRDALGDGGLDVTRAALQDVHACVQEPGATSVAACYAPDATAWRTQAASACSGVNPYSELGYSQACNAQNVLPIFPGACGAHAYPCTMFQSSLSSSGTDDDLLDCLTCQLEEAALGVARTIYGVNLCCIGGVCNRVLTRVACREAGGTPTRYVMSSLTGVDSVGAHGIDVGPDDKLYMTAGSNITRVDPTNGSTTTVGTVTAFSTGVAADTAGNVYVTQRCEHKVLKIAPGGVSSLFAGTGVAGYSGDGGLATAAQIAAPDGIAVDPAGNVYFTVSGSLAFGCGDGGGGIEGVRMVDTNGMIHTIAGGGSGPAGGPALGALFSIPYGLHLASDGTFIIGEAGSHRVLRIDGTGTLVHLAGEPLGITGRHAGYGGPAVRARFYQNCGVADDPDGNVVVAPMEDNRIALLDTLGSVIAIAGTGEGTSSTDPDNVNIVALLGDAGCPEDIAVDSSGTIYFSDLQMRRIRVLKRIGF